MPKHVQRAAVAKINPTRQGPGGRKWNPNKDTVICNVHYADCKGPTREDRELLPINFKRSSNFSTPSPSKKSRHGIDSAWSSMLLELNESLAADCAAGRTDPFQAGELSTSEAGELGTCDESVPPTCDESVPPTCNDPVPTTCDESVSPICDESSELEVRYHQLLRENENLSVENSALKEEIQLLRTNAHCLTVSLLDDSKLLMYTGITRKVLNPC